MSKVFISSLRYSIYKVQLLAEASLAMLPQASAFVKHFFLISKKTFFKRLRCRACSVWYYSALIPVCQVPFFVFSLFISQKTAAPFPERRGHYFRIIRHRRSGRSRRPAVYKQQRKHRRCPRHGKRRRCVPAGSSAGLLPHGAWAGCGTS